MTDGFYYNCLVPNAMVQLGPDIGETADHDDSQAPPIPPRLHEQERVTTGQVLRSPKGPDDEVFKPAKAVRWQSSDSLLQNTSGGSLSPGWDADERVKQSRHASTPEKWQTFENLDLSTESHHSRSPSWSMNTSSDSYNTSGSSAHRLDSSIESQMSRMSGWSMSHNSSIDTPPTRHGSLQGPLQGPRGPPGHQGHHRATRSVDMTSQGHTLQLSPINISGPASGPTTPNGINNNNKTQDNEGSVSTVQESPVSPSLSPQGGEVGPVIPDLDNFPLEVRPPPLLPPRPPKFSERFGGDQLSSSLGSLKSSWRTNNERGSSDYPLQFPRRYEYHQSHPPRQSSTEGENAVMGQEKTQTVGVLRPTFSFKEKSARPQSAYVGAPSQPLPTQQETVQQESAVVIRKRRTALQSASAQLNRRSLPTPRILIDTSCLDDFKPRSPTRNHDTKKSRSPSRKSKSPTRHSEKEKKGKNSVFTSPNTGTYLQWRRASAVAVDRPIAEEGEIESATRLDLGQSNITEAISQSIESLDEVDSVQEVRFEDVELGNLMTDEPETWSETMDKKVLKKWNQKEVKRQDTIWELIQTERQYCKRLKTLQIFFRDGMLRELNINSAWVERMFPHLDDLIFIHLNFLRELQDLQNKKQDRSVEILGPTLNRQFSGESAKQMKVAYGIFCSGHLEAVQLYKDFVSKDRKFQAFIKQRMNLPMCKKREIPDYILLITQRPTKYPTLIEAVIKSTKDKKDRESLLSALELSKEVLQNVNETVAAAERQMRLKEIYSRMDTRSFAIHKGKKFKKFDITANGRKLLYEGLCGYKNARGKTVEVLAVLLNDVFFFLQDNNQKYSFFAQDNKNGVVSLFNLLVREKRDTRDSKGMYIISQSKVSPEMYEVIFSSTLEMQRWAQVMRTAAERCPAEEDEADPSAEEERRFLEKQEKAQSIMNKLSLKDVEIKKCCDEKNKLMMDLIAVYNDAEEQHSRPSSKDFDEATAEDTASSRSSILQAALQEVSHAASQLTTMLQGNGTNLSRSVSSVGEHASHTYTAIPIPKRAETFAGFDTTHDNPRVKKKGAGPDNSDYTDRSMEGDTQDNSQSDLSADNEVPPPIPQRMPFDNEADSDRGSSISSMSLLSPASAIYNSQEQSNIASLVRTLNSIVHLTCQQSTAVETLRCQLAEANERINKLSVDVHEKKSGYKHNQLEELRNLQGVIQKEKEEWELKKERENSFMEMERNELEEMRKRLEKQEADIKQQKEELNKKREVLQKQMDLLRQSGQLPNPDGAGSSSELQTDFVKGHRRSASAEAFPGKNDQESSSRTASVAPKESFRSDQRPSVTKLQSFSFGSSKQTMPEHLLSAKNEQKIGAKNVQQLPSKLLSGGLSETPPKQAGSLPPNSSPEQGQSGANVTLGGVHGNNSTPSFTQEQVGHGDAKSNLGHSSSAGVLSSHSNQHGSAVVVSAGNRQSNRPKQSGLAGLTGVMKLAEKGDKKGVKGSSPSQSGSEKGGSPGGSEKSDQSDKRPKSGSQVQKNPNINHKPQKSDSEVIYF